MNKPHCAACDKNQKAILEVILSLFSNCRNILEIGSGTGQHAVYFAERMPHLTWQTSDKEENHAGINMWLSDAALGNTRMPVELDVSQNNWSELEADAIFSANTAHIMSWDEVVHFINGVGKLLMTNGYFCLYGPFNYNKQYTSESNARFDQWLKSRDILSGIRNFEDLDQLANNVSMSLFQDYEMPANNRLLCWRKKS